MTLMDQEDMENNKSPTANKCPRKEAIKALGNIIGELQEHGHAIVLMIDANQTPKVSTTKTSIKPFSIKLL
jgi:hypothetical protein